MKAPRVSGAERQPREPSGEVAGFKLSAEDQHTLMKMFLDTSHEDLRLLDEALRGRKTDDALHRVHRLYGAALTVGATSLVSELERFEISMRLALRIPADSQQRLDRLRQNLLDYQRFQLL